MKTENKSSQAAGKCYHGRNSRSCSIYSLQLGRRPLGQNQPEPEHSSHSTFTLSCMLLSFPQLFPPPRMKREVCRFVVRISAFPPPLISASRGDGLFENFLRTVVSSGWWISRGSVLWLQKNMGTHPTDTSRNKPTLWCLYPSSHLALLAHLPHKCSKGQEKCQLWIGLWPHCASIPAATVQTVDNKDAFWETLGSAMPWTASNLSCPCRWGLMVKGACPGSFYWALE